MNKKIGLVGEDPNDTESIRFLLDKKFSGSVSYQILMRRITGYNLDSDHTKRILKVECDKQKPDIVIFIRDADGICTEKKKIETCERKHKDLSKALKVKSILLLNIYELEALIFADIDTFNRVYKTEIKGGGDVTYIAEPKEKLKRHTRKMQKTFHESHCPEIFKEMNIDNVIANCSYFREFMTKLDQMINN